MDPLQLEAFITIVEAGSFTRAAAKLGVAQPTITNRIKTLEQNLGAKLLARLPAGVTPTDAGHQLLPYAREILKLTRIAREAVGACGEPHGRIEVGCFESLINHRLLPLIEYLYIRYPKIRLAVHSSTGQDAIASVRNGQLDCAFFVDAETSHDDVAVRVLCPEPLVLVAAPGHVVLGRTKVTAADLRATTLVCSDLQASCQARFIGTLEDGMDLATLRTLELDSVDAAKRSVASGIGVALLPELAVADEIESGVLVRVPWDSPLSTYTQVASRRNRDHHPALQVVITMAQRVIDEQLVKA